MVRRSDPGLAGLTRPGSGLDHQLVAGFLDCGSERDHFGVSFGADSDLSGLKVDFDVSHSGHLRNLGLNSRHAVAARHAVDCEDALLHGAMITAATYPGVRS